MRMGEVGIDKLIVGKWGWLSLGEDREFRWGCLRLEDFVWCEYMLGEAIIRDVNIGLQ